MIKADFIIIGAGIAGTSAAYHFAEHGKTIVLEKESQPGYHSTGRSAAIFSAHHGPETICKLALANYDFFHNPAPDFTDMPLLSDKGMLFIGDEETKDLADQMLSHTDDPRAALKIISTEEAIKKVPFLKKENTDHCLYYPGAQEIDVAALHQAYIKNLKKRGGEIHTDTSIKSISKKGALWQIVTNNETYETPTLINAAGGWADHVATLAGIKTIGLVPKRRTVISIDLPEEYKDLHAPMVIFLDQKLYFKTETGGLIASPMDQTPVEACDVQPEEIDIATAAYYLEERTTLEIKNIKTKWAGLRSFAPDGVPVIDRAPEDSSFIWLAGQGGYGIKTCDAMARCAVEIALNDDLPEDCKKFIRREELSASRNYSKSNIMMA